MPITLLKNNFKSLQITEAYLVWVAKKKFSESVTFKSILKDKVLLVKFR